MSHQHAETLILGAGPAGLQLGYHLEKRQRDYLILEGRETPGAFFKEQPRHRKLISINKIYTGYDDPELNLRWDWNSLLNDADEMMFKHYSKKYFPDADDMVRYLNDYAAFYNLNLCLNTAIVSIERPDRFLLTDDNGNTFSGDQLIVATGLFKPNRPDVPGQELLEHYNDMSIDPEDYLGQRVLIIGKGNSAFETADNLLATTSLIHMVSPQPLSLAWRTKHVGHLRAVNMSFLDSYQLKSQNVLLDANIKAMKRNDKGEIEVTFHYNHAEEEVETLIYDRVLSCAGFAFDNSIFGDSCKPERTIRDRFPNQTHEWESTNVPDLYFAGALMQMRDFKKKQSAFIHGFRYNVENLARIIDAKYYETPVAHRDVAQTPQAMARAMLDHINYSSALWQQTAFMCDALVLPEDGPARMYEDLALDYVHGSDLAKGLPYFTISLEFGLDMLEKFPNTFAVDRVHKDNFAKAHESVAIHPIIRYYRDGQLQATHHVIEDLASEWKEPVHIEPLEQFLASILSPATVA